MTKVSYVIKTKNGNQYEVAGYEKALEIVSEQGGTIATRYSKVVDNEPKGKYVGRTPKSKYVPPYHDRLYATN